MTYIYVVEEFYICIVSEQIKIDYLLTRIVQCIKSTKIYTYEEVVHDLLGAITKLSFIGIEAQTSLSYRYNAIIFLPSTKGKLDYYSRVITQRFQSRVVRQTLFKL